MLAKQALDTCSHTRDSRIDDELLGAGDIPPSPERDERIRMLIKQHEDFTKRRYKNEQ